MTAQHTTIAHGCLRRQVADWDATRRRGSHARPDLRKWVWSTASGFGGYWTLV